MKRRTKLIGVAALVLFLLIFGFFFSAKIAPAGDKNKAPNVSSDLFNTDDESSSGLGNQNGNGLTIHPGNASNANSVISSGTSDGTDTSGGESTSHRPEGNGTTNLSLGGDSDFGGNGRNPGTAPHGSSSSSRSSGGFAPVPGHPVSSTSPVSSKPAGPSSIPVSSGISVPGSSSSQPDSASSSSGHHSGGGSHSKPKAQVAFDLPAAAYTDTKVRISPVLKNTLTLRWTLTRTGTDGTQQPVELAKMLNGTLDSSGGTVTFLQSGKYTMTAAAANSSGQEAICSHSITVYPVAGFAFSLPEFTHTDQAIPVTVSGERNGLELSWSVQNDGKSVDWDSTINGTPTNDGGIFTFKEPGNYSVTATAKDSAGRKFSHAEKIKVYPVITLDFKLPETAHTDTEIDLPVTQENADSSKVEWSLTKNGELVSMRDAIDGDLSATGGTIRFTDKGVYTLTAQITDETGLVFSKSVTTTIYPVGSVGFYLPEICHTDDSVTVETSFENLGGDAAWALTKDGEPVAWENCVEGSLNNDGGTIRFKEKGSYTLTASYTDPAGRSYTYSSLVKVYPVPTLSFKAPETAHTDTDVIIKTEAADLDGLTLEWLLDNTYGIQDWNTFVDGKLDNNGGTIQFKHAGVYELVSRVTDETGRTFLFETGDKIDVLPSLEVSFGLPESAYTDDTIKIRTLGNIGGLPVEWSLEMNGQTIALGNVLEGKLNDQGGNIRFKESGIYTLTASMADALGREFTHSETVRVRPVAQCSFAIPASARVNAAIPISMQEVSGLSGKSIVWSLTKDGVTAGDSGSLTDAGGSITIGAPGSYTLTASVTDDAGRVFSCSQNIEVTNTAPTNPTGSASVTRSVKDGRFYVNFSIQSTDPDGDAVSYEYEGQCADGYYPVGSHSVRVRAKDSCGAYSGWTEIRFTVSNSAPTAPVISRNPGGNSVAPGTPVTITASSSDPDGDAVHYIWEGRPAEVSFGYPLGKNVVRVKAVDAAGAESPWAAIVFFVADPSHGGGMTLTGPESVILENGLEGATISGYTFTVPPVSGHNGNDYGRVRGYNIQTGKWDQLDYRTTNNGITFTRSLTPGVYSQLEFYYYTNHDCMYHKSNITYSVNFYWNTN